MSEASPMTVDSPEQEEMSFYRVVDASCDLENSIPQKEYIKVGHLLKLSINGKDLVPDTPRWNPQYPDKKSEVVGIIERIIWDGKPTDPLDMTLRLSFKNKASLLECFCSSKGRPEIVAEWVIYDYDYNDNSYFPTFYTKGPVKLTLNTNNVPFYISPEPDRRYGAGPVNFALDMSLSPQKGSEEQQLFLAFSASGKTFTRPIIAKE